MQVREQYELRIKKSQDNSKAKTPEITIKKRPDKSSKVTTESSKSAAESSEKKQGKRQPKH